MDDDTLRKALKESHWQDDEVAVLEEVWGVFKGRQRWLSIIAWSGGLVFMGVLIVSTVRFFQAEDQKSMIMWAAVWIFSMVAIAMMKVWFWMRMDRNAVIREVKRVELRVVEIAERLGG